MLRRLSLSAWLALGLVAAIALPALGGAAAWWAVDARQRADLDRRTAEAAAAVAAAPVGLTLDARLARTLARLDVEAELSGGVVKEASLLTGGRTKEVARAMEHERDIGPIAKPEPARTSGLAALLLERSDGKRALQEGYVERPVPGAQLFLPEPDAAARIAGAGIAALVLLALVLAAGSALLRRWVVHPLARLSRDVEQVAGGHVAVEPVSSRAREIADIGTALNGMAAGLRRALAERDAAEEQRRFLVASIAHDLRTPLFTLRGSLEAIERGIGDADHLARAQRKATVLDGLIGDLFTYSRLEYAEPDLQLEPLDAVALARDAAEAVDPRIVVSEPAGGAIVTGDHGALLRMLTNLLDNAVRHARSRVELAVERDGDTVLLVVTDDGPGIAPADRPQVFEPLFRGDRARNSATGGAGLGLAIVERLADAQGAAVSVDEAPDGGARFTVRCAGAAGVSAV